MAGKASVPCNVVVTGYSQLYFNINIPAYIAKDSLVNIKDTVSAGEKQKHSALVGIRRVCIAIRYRL